MAEQGLKDSVPKTAFPPPGYVLRRSRNEAEKVRRGRIIAGLTLRSEGFGHPAVINVAQRGLRTEEHRG